jgi:hypothetical protein
MARRNLLNAAVLAALVPFASISCSSSDSNNGSGGAAGTGGTGGAGGTAGTGGSGGSNSTDGGTSDGTSSDAPSSSDSGGKGDSASDAGVSDAGRTLPDGSVPPNGTQLASGAITLVGVTSDNFAVYTDDTAMTLNAISLAGGTPTMLGSASDRAVVIGGVVLTWTGNARVSPLSVWTSAHGQKVLGMTSSASATAVAVSPDSAHVLFFDGVDASRTMGNLFVAGTDGSAPTQLVASVVLNNTACTPAMSFGGNTAAAAAFCVAPSADGGAGDAGAGDAGTSDGAAPLPATVQSYRGATWTATTLATNVQPRVVVSPTDTAVLVNAAAGLVVYPIAGGAGTTIDADGGVGMFTSDGLSVIYTTTASALKRVSLSAPTPVTLAASGIAGVRAKSGDDKWILGYTMIDTRQDLSDLYLASTTTPGAPTTLSTAMTAGLFTSDGFTTDSSHAIYYTDIDVTGGVGTFYAVPTSGGTPVTISTNVWIHHAALGAKVVFNDNYSQSLNASDIRVVDTSQSAATPKLVVSLADPDYFLSGTKDKVVYTWSYLTSSMAGLWATVIP